MDPRPHALYRFYDADDTLLYVGITFDPGQRWRAHRQDKPWWHEVTQIRVETHPDRLAALEAERAAIIDEKPRYNVVHNRTAHGAHRCPACGRASTYDVASDRYLHNDGSDQDSCHIAILRGERFRPSTSHNLPYTAAENLWCFSTLRSGYERTTPLCLSWEVNCTAMSDDYYSDEATAAELLDMWLRRYPDERRIYWSVTAPSGQAIHESAPFQRHGFTDGRSFLTYFTWPRNAHTRERLNWSRLPVLDGFWNDRDGSKGGFFQEATGWKPAPLQCELDLEQILAAAGHPRPDSDLATAHQTSEWARWSR